MAVHLIQRGDDGHAGIHDGAQRGDQHARKQDVLDAQACGFADQDQPFALFCAEAVQMHHIGQDQKEDQRYDDAGHGGHDGRVGLLALAIEQQQRHGDGEDRAQDADRDRRISREYHRQQHADDQIQAVCQTEDRLHALALCDEHDGQDEHGDAECHRDGAVIIVQRVIWLDPFRLIDIDDDRHALADFALVRIGDIVGHFDLFSLVFPFIQPDDQILRAHVDVKVFFIGQVFCSDLHDRSFHIFQRGAVKAAV